MKKSAAQTIGAAALGAAFAVVAAGTASAAVPAVGLTDALGSATGALQGVTSQQQVGAEEGHQSSDPTSQVTGLLNPLTGGLNGLGG
ncbi:hypothetical protein AB0P12_21155 [Streptomyces subrutilus]|uniref:ATP-binding protein n=1 Tax=Streptomyces subrutilus TaxID=36818 RepID=A0A5P2UND0_9ACTN|nr:hypothetical protein [Streptomyces subrutilus]QEU79121.1 hypothetical protein CP968_13115 [Streptomyces subrutilus]WSJ31686.1 hypothetical protein OG479_21720 [Streptomyces subrutilus]GGZ51982.1 hypothetical protein GCM10010371_09280 [Streptomyces subrutilus]